MCMRKNGTVISYAGPYRLYREYHAVQLAAPFVWSSCAFPVNALPGGLTISFEFKDDEDPKALFRYLNQIPVQRR